MHRLLNKWDFILASTLAVSGCWLLDYNAVEKITTELIAFFSIQSAVILPAMIFTAGILKPDGLELDEIRGYHKALRDQMRFWVVLLALDFVAVASLIAGKGIGWELEIPIPNLDRVIDLSWIFPASLYFSGSLAIFRTIPFVKGVLSLLDLNSDMAEKAVKRRNRLEGQTRDAQSAKKPMTLPEGYGSVVNAETPTAVKGENSD